MWYIILIIVIYLVVLHYRAKKHNVPMSSLFVSDIKALYKAAEKQQEARDKETERRNQRIDRKAKYYSTFTREQLEAELKKAEEKNKSDDASAIRQVMFDKNMY